jgi:hypothetical protein
MRTAGLSIAAGALLLAVHVGCDQPSAARDQAASGTLPAVATPTSPLPQPTANSKAIGAPADAPKVDASGIMESTFDDLKFPMDKAAKFERSMLTPKVQSLFGERIRIRGYMFPTPQKRGIKQFVLVRDNMECCFGPGAALYDCVLVTMEPGETTEYSIRPIAVEGEFRLEELAGPDGRPLAIYQMKGETVK